MSTARHNASVTSSPDTIRELSPADALTQQQQGAVLVDIRDTGEYAIGAAAHARNIPFSLLETHLKQSVSDTGKQLLLMCAAGRRSLLAAQLAQRMGYRDVSSVAGGFMQWQMEGLPVKTDGIAPDMAQRYARQIQLPQVGAEGQAKLAKAKVVIVGAGGLGSPAALYLAAAGIGHITLIDNDKVELSNLQRQILHTDARTGMPKTDSARLTIEALNPAIRVETHNERLVAGNVEHLLKDHDLIIDGSDNFPTRYLLTAASLRLKLPMIYGAVERFSGQLSVFDPLQEGSPCYRCLFPEPPAADDAPNCSEAGVLGVLPGNIGLLQATEALKLILGLGEPLVGEVLSFDALTMQFRKLHLPRNPECPGCSELAASTNYHDVEAICSSMG